MTLNFYIIFNFFKQNLPIKRNGFIPTYRRFPSFNSYTIAITQNNR
jgi:hypothetical protein